jgi:recombination protein RecT
MANGPKTDASGRIQRPPAANGAQNGAQNGGGGSGDLARETTGDPAVVSARQALMAMKGEISKALPKHVDPERMLRVLLTALSSTPKLALCTKESFFGSILQASQLGLEPNTPLQHCWLLPYENRRSNTLECQLQIGYQGMIELSLRSGRVANISAHVVRTGDLFEYELGLEPRLKHIPSEAEDREDQPIRYAYSVARIKDADPAFEVLSFPQIIRRARRSQSWDQRSDQPKFGPWLDHFESMARKTAVRAVWKYIPKSTQMAQAEALELAIERGTQQPYDFVVNDALDRQGVRPIEAQALPQPAESPYPGVDRATGEVAAQAEPGANG